MAIGSMLSQLNQVYGQAKEAQDEKFGYMERKGFDRSKYQEMLDKAKQYESKYGKYAHRNDTVTGGRVRWQKIKDLKGAAKDYLNKYSVGAEELSQFKTEDATKSAFERLGEQSSAAYEDQMARSAQDRAMRDMYLKQQQAGFTAMQGSLDQFGRIASGQDSAAQRQYQQSRDDALRNALSLSSTGGPGGALATNQAMQQYANIQPQLAQGAATAMAQERLGAIGAGANVANAMLGRQQGAAGLLQGAELGYQGIGQQGLGFQQGQQQYLLDDVYRNRQLAQQMDIAKVQAGSERREQNIG